MNDLAKMYRELWNDAGPGVAKYVAGLDAEAMAEVKVNANGRPVLHLWVRRSGAAPNTTPWPEGAADLAREILIIAHETAHLELFREDGESFLRVQAIQKRLRENDNASAAGATLPHTEPTPSEHAESLDEEVRAWTRASELLAAKLWSDWPAFERTRDAALDTYRMRARQSA